MVYGGIINPLLFVLLQFQVLAILICFELVFNSFKICVFCLWFELFLIVGFIRELLTVFYCVCHGLFCFVFQCCQVFYVFDCCIMFYQWFYVFFTIGFLPVCLVLLIWRFAFLKRIQMFDKCLLRFVCVASDVLQYFKRFELFFIVIMVWLIVLNLCRLLNACSCFLNFICVGF